MLVDVLITNRTRIRILHHDVLIILHFLSLFHLVQALDGLVLGHTNRTAAHLLRTLKLILLLAGDELLELVHVRDILCRHVLDVRPE